MPLRMCWLPSSCVMTDERSVAAPGSLGRKVFVIHGRDQRARHEVYIFLRAIGLDPIEWHEALDIAGGGAPFIGDVLDAVLKSRGAFIVLLTPDDVVYLKHEHADDDEDFERKPSGQARPNVLFEAGMALALAPNRTVLVEFGKVRPFTDIGGRFVVKLDGTTQKRHTLAQRLKSIGCDVKLDGNDWQSAGNLTPPVTKVESTKSALAQLSDSVSARPSEATPGQITGDPGDRKLVFDNFSVLEGRFGSHSVHGEVTSEESATMTLFLSATFYGQERQVLGTASDVVSSLASGKMMTFKLTTRDKVDGWATVRVQVDSAYKE